MQGKCREKQELQSEQVADTETQVWKARLGAGWSWCLGCILAGALGCSHNLFSASPTQAKCTPTASPFPSSLQ